MKMVFKAFLKNIFGENLERYLRMVLIDLIVFGGLFFADFKIRIAPSVLYLMVSVSTAGVMWRALSSKESVVNMQNMVMLPFERRGFVFSYVAVLGLYTCLTKTAALLAVLFAVSYWNPIVVLGSALCAGNAVLVAAAVCVLKKYWYTDGLWIIALFAGICCLGDGPWFWPMLFVSGAAACLALQRADGYVFCVWKSGKSEIKKYREHASIWIYFFRYLKEHKNYWMNMAVMWCVACALPAFLGSMERAFAVPIGFAVLSLNTPVCILLSCDPDLECAVRYLPGQKRMFCVPYVLFIFLCNIAAYAVFLCSLQIQAGGVTAYMLILAVFFAIQSAVSSVFLEWAYPIRGWNIESDLWHHPRKYMVPAVMLLFSGVVMAAPVLGLTLSAVWVMGMGWAVKRHSE